MMNPWGTRGLQPIYRPGDDGGPIEDVGRFFDPNRAEVTRNGQQWVRVGENLAETMGGWDPAAQQYLRTLSGEQLGVYDPTEGWIIPGDVYGQLAQIMGPINAGGSLDPVAKAAFAAMAGAGLGFAMGPGFAGFEAMGTAIPGMAEGTTLLQSLGYGSPQSWGVNPRTGLDMTTQDLVNLANPQNTMQMSIPGISTPGSTFPGVGFAGSAADLLKAASSNASFGGNGGGTSWSDLLTPKNLLTGAGLIGSAIGQGNAMGDAASAASAAQMQAAGLGIGEQRRQFDAVKALLEPYTQAGVRSLTGQEDLLGLRGGPAQQAAISALESSPQFASLVEQGENAILQNASATGGLRGGNIQATLAKFRPEVLSRLIDQQYSRLGGVTSLGQNAAAFTGNAGMQTGANIANLQQQAGAAQAGNELAQGKANANIWGAIANGIGLYAGLSGGF